MLKELEKKMSRLEKLVAERIQENKICNCKAKSQKVLSRELLDELFIQVLVNMMTHPKQGDLALVKMLEIGYKRTGAIQPARNQFNNQNNNASGAVAGRTYYEVFKSAWLIEKEREMARRAEQEWAEEAGKQGALPCPVHGLRQPGQD
jgi:hypothetical protein